jgi:SPX domain protein involved in polyphosphate accumulation
MAGEDGTFAQRFEYKYLITESRADKVRDFVSSYMCLDSHAVKWVDQQYPVSSLYLDSRDLALYYATLCGEKNRFKLRIRIYDDEPDSPAYLEIKARKNDVICKQRAGVRKSCLERLVSNYYVDDDDLTNPSDGELDALHRFCELCVKMMARPKAIVRYWREPYVDPWGGSIRVTFDRRIGCFRTDDPIVRVNGDGWVDLPDPWVVLEVKFTDAYPLWARDMVQACDLPRSSAAKYVRSVNTLMELGVRVAG